jgi:hypothetical protein
MEFFARWSPEAGQSKRLVTVNTEFTLTPKTRFDRNRTSAIDIRLSVNGMPKELTPPKFDAEFDIGSGDLKIENVRLASLCPGQDFLRRGLAYLGQHIECKTITFDYVSNKAASELSDEVHRRVSTGRGCSDLEPRDPLTRAAKLLGYGDVTIVRLSPHTNESHFVCRPSSEFILRHSARYMQPPAHQLADRLGRLSPQC